MAYVDLMNRDMNFSSALKIKVDEVENQPTKRFFAKVENKSIKNSKLLIVSICFQMASNSLLGKLSQSSDKTTTIAVSSQDEINNLINDPLVEIKDFFLIGDKVVQIALKRLSPFQRQTSKTNVILGAYVTW